MRAKTSPSVYAAFDVGSGATKMTCASVVKRGSEHVIQETLYSKQVEVLVGNSLRAAEDGKTIPDDTLLQLERALSHLKDKAVEHGATQFSGIATAAFRQASNGTRFLDHLEAKHNIHLELISQEEEGAIGFLSAVGGAGDHARKEHIVAWDSGGASFQLSALKHDGNLFVFEGPWGSSNVTCSMVEEIQGKSFKECESVNPTTEEEAAALLALVKERLASEGTPAWLQKKIQRPSTKVVAIGGETSMFQMIHLITGEYTFSRDDLWRGICSSAGKKDSELEHTFLQAGMMIPKLVLCTAVCDLFHIGEFHYTPTNGSTKGILLSPKYWK